MFDTAKVQWMAEELENFAREYKEIYIFPQWLTAEAFALFRRAGLNIRGVVLNDLRFVEQKEFYGYPLVNFEEVLKNFTIQTGIIYLSKKTSATPKCLMEIGKQKLLFPVFVLTFDETLAIYDCLTTLKVLQQYKDDGLAVPDMQAVAERFARGLTTLLDPDVENIKFQFWDRNYFKPPKYSVDDTAIVLRGQIVHENRYTERTLEFYRSVYPDTPIIVSTWKNEITDEFYAACQKNSVVLLKNIQPEIPGFCHLNYQLENAFQGVEYVRKNLNTKFISVMRTDQRLNRFDFLLHFRNLIQEFPPLGDKLQGRILILSCWLATKYLPFSIADFLAFGFTDDIYKFYDLPRLQDVGEHQYFNSHMPRFFKMREILRRATFKRFDFSKHGKKLKKFNLMTNHFVDADIFWMKNFYRKYISPLDETKLLETWWNFIREYLLFVDTSSLIFDWPKYEDNRRYGTVTKGMDFSQWLELYRNFNVK